MLEIKAGNRFRVEINGAVWRVVKVEGKNAVIADEKTGRTFVMGVKALEKNLSAPIGEMEPDG